MSTTYKRIEGRNTRAKRVRRKLAKSNLERPRLSVFRSDKHIYAQIIDDRAGKTLLAVSTQSKDLKGALKKTATVDAAKQVGQLVAKKALEKKISEVRFDRGGFMYHGRVKALADAAREGGLKF